MQIKSITGDVKRNDCFITIEFSFSDFIEYILKNKYTTCKLCGSSYIDFYYYLQEFNFNNKYNLIIKCKNCNSEIIFPININTLEKILNLK